eukprot:2792542-Rhodomonas_salina.3
MGAPEVAPGTEPVQPSGVEIEYVADAMRFRVWAWEHATVEDAVYGRDVCWIWRAAEQEQMYGVGNLALRLHIAEDMMGRGSDVADRHDACAEVCEHGRGGAVTEMACAHTVLVWLCNKRTMGWLAHIRSSSCGCLVWDRGRSHVYGMGQDL